MNRISLLALLTLLLSGARPAAVAPPRLLVRADDMGASHAANVACLQAVNEGIARSIEVMVPGPWFPEAVRLLRDHPGIDVGVHLVLTSEWEGVKWRPLTAVPSLTDARGYFHPFIWPNDRPGQTFLLDQDWQLAEVEQELRAQIELALAEIPQVTHFSSHMGCGHMAPEVTALLRDLAREYGLVYVDDLDLARGLDFGPRETRHDRDAKLAAFLASLDRLEAGKTYLHVTHPGLDTDELRATGHSGYTGVAADRAGDTWVLMHPEVRARIRAQGIALVGYGDL